MIRPVFLIYCLGLMFQAPSIRAFLYMFSLHVFLFIVGAITLKSTPEEVAKKGTKRASSGRSNVFKLSLFAACSETAPISDFSAHLESSRAREAYYTP